MESLQKKLVTAKFLQDQGRNVATAARTVEGVDDDLVRRVVRLCSDLSKSLMDSRAAEIAAANPPEPTPSRKTNVGNPAAKGAKGAK